MTSRNDDVTTYTLTYDAENRLTGVSGGATASFVYDGDGQRVKATFGTSTVAYVGDYFEWKGSTSTMVKYYYANGQRVAMRVGSSTVYYLLTDHLGSTAITANSSGSRVAELRYKAWGETRYTWGTTPTAYKFTGQRLDDSTGLYYYGARYYDAALGRFVQPDTLVQADAKNPIPYLPLAVSYADPKILERWNQLQRSRLQPGAQAPNTPSTFDPQFLNRYTYSRNNPLAYVDDSGHIAWWIVGGVVGGVVGFGAYALTHQDTFDWGAGGAVDGGWGGGRCYVWGRCPVGGWNHWCASSGYGWHYRCYRRVRRCKLH